MNPGIHNTLSAEMNQKNNIQNNQTIQNVHKVHSSKRSLKDKHILRNVATAGHIMGNRYPSSQPMMIMKNGKLLIQN